MINTRIKEIRKKEKLSQEKFGKELGVSRDVINNIENGRVEPKELLINHICNIYMIKKDWILTGNGEMYEDNEKLSKALAEISLNENELLKEIAIKLSKLDKKYLNLINELIDKLIEKK